jgi:hypothetical protein
VTKTYHKLKNTDKYNNNNNNNNNNNKEYSKRGPIKATG